MRTKDSAYFSRMVAGMLRAARSVCVRARVVREREYVYVCVCLDSVSKCESVLPGSWTSALV